MSAASGTSGGLRGGSASLPLVDLLQVWSLNHFSGLVSVSAGARDGKLHFVEGEIVHAEAEGLEGEAAVRIILSWSGVSFEPFPNTTTLKRTIQKRVSHLLLDAHRELDEARRAPAPTMPSAGTFGAPAHTPPPTGGSVFEQLRALPGVTGLVRFGADGRPAGTGATEAAAEGLAAKALYLSMTHGGAVGQTFGLRDFWLAALESPVESLIVVHSGAQYLALAITPGVPLEPLVTQVRALLTRSAQR
jgi:Domain of unknown function (DUF4388)